ncbi:MAG: hypothetical protein ACI8QZ_001045 [Chlamydiales bacterium]|jgi:hypothetical protein
MQPAPSTAPQVPPQTASGRRPRVARHLLVLLPLLLLLITGLRGIDFGKHWDERVQVDVLHTAIDSQTLLPKWYRYPSVIFWMTFGALAPEIAAEIPRDAAQMKATQARLNSTVESPEFRLRMRTVFLSVTCLTILWTYLLALTCFGSALGAFLAASCIGLSWEVAYHARWIAPDGVLMQFSTLTLLLLALAVTRRDSRWLVGAALAAGFSCGTKYTGGILLLPLLIAAAQVWKQRSMHARAVRAAGLLGVFVLAFVLTTPGAVLQPFIFLRHVGFEIDHYRTGHYGATIDSGLPHLAAMMRYLFVHLFSQQVALALLVSISAAIGLMHCVRRAPRTALLLASFPIAYLLYMSTQRVLFVRNLLFVAPVIAVFAAHGATGLWSSLGGSRRSAGARAQLAAAGMLGLALWAVNGSFLIMASESIRARDPDADVRAFSAWADARPDQRLFLSTRVAESLERLDLAAPANATRVDGPDVDAAAFFPAETISSSLRANRPGTALAIFGAMDVNFEFYPVWKEPKLLVYPAAAARDAGILGDG